MDMTKDICVNCVKKADCTTREEIHEDNFIVSECDTIVLEPTSGCKCGKEACDCKNTCNKNA